MGLEGWQTALIALAGVVALITVVAVTIKSWARGAYEKQRESAKSDCDIDAFVGPDNPPNYVKCAVAGKLTVGNKKVSTNAIPLMVRESKDVQGLWVTERASDDGAVPTGAKLLKDLLVESKDKKPIVVATIRMGFGHHRLAYSVSSWAMQTGRPTIFHDLISIKSDEADLIKSTDALYSKFSRMASEMGGIVEKIWGSAMMQGDANALRMAAYTAAHLQALMLSFPKDTPIVTTHQLCALVAASAGFTNVVNLVVDNYPQWFLTVPKTLNLVQGPVNYAAFLRFGIDAKELAWAGHWCPHDMVSSIDLDCKRRIDRAMKGDRKPLRILVPVGGAGAQRSFIISFVKALAPLIKANKVQLMLNAGDHAHMKTAFLQVLDESGLDFESVGDTDGVRAFQQRLLNETMEPNKNVTLFAFDKYFPAVATTDIVCRVTDVLCCKPSEMAFYCVPKLHIRRVGDHEAASAKRSSECGDGTEEAREVEEAIKYVNLFLSMPDLLVSMNTAIMKNNKIGIYSGCDEAVKYVLKNETK